MVSGMLSLQNISVVKSAVLICLVPELKKEILCVPGSEYDTCKSSYQYYRKEQWNEIVERKAKEIMKRWILPEILGRKVLNILPAIALRMLIWAEYHEGSLDLDRYYSLNFLSFAHFSAQGVIDKKKTAEDMIKDANLSAKQKYKLACIYCLKFHIDFSFRQIVREKKNIVFGPEDSKWMEKPEIVRYWTYQMTGATDDRYRYTPVYLFSLETAIKSGSTEAVKYSLEKAGKHYRENAYMYATIEILKQNYDMQDWIVFSDSRYNDSKGSWIPTDYRLDILCFLLSNMTESEQQDALEENIKSNETHPSRNKHITVLEYFLSWPYQEYFIKTAEVLWKLLPENTYAAILFKMCDIIDHCKIKNLLYGEGKSYDYKKLLKDFWNQSPDHFKRYVFKNNQLSIYKNDSKVKIKTGTDLLLKLLSLKEFTYEDEEIIWLILGSATGAEKANLKSAGWWRSSISGILKKEKFEIFDRLLLVLFKSQVEASKFKERLNLYIESLPICKHFLKYGKISAIKSFINRISIPERWLHTLKRDLIYSDEGTRRCGKLLSFGRDEDFEEFINWFLPRPEDSTAFKKNLKVYIGGDLPNIEVQQADVINFISRFTRSLLPNEAVINNIQTSIVETFGRAICKDLIMGSSINVVYRETDSSVIVVNQFTGGQWGRIEKFLTWGLSTEDEILAFKKNLYKEAGVKIHYYLVKAEQWNVAKRFYNWLQLTEAEIKSLKERAIYDHDIWSMLHYLMFTPDDEMYNLETIDLLLRWHLTDKEVVIQFRDTFLHSHRAYDEAGLKKFNSLIENYLDDFDKKIYQTCRNAEERFFRYLDRKGLKRKCIYYPQRKKMRYSQSNVKTSSKRRSKRLNRTLKKR